MEEETKYLENKRGEAQKLMKTLAEVQETERLSRCNSAIIDTLRFLLGLTLDELDAIMDEQTESVG